jgi:hypothetical protein
VTPKLCFASGGICGSRSAFHCIRDTKQPHTIFHARLGPVQIQQKSDGTRYAKHVFLHRYGFQKEREETRYTELVFLHPVGFAGHVVHCDAFGALKVNAFGAHAPVARVRIPQRV